jgi:hypothetical protein
MVNGINDCQSLSTEPQVLTWQQLQFLARRLLNTTDADAAREIGVAPETVCRWKTDNQSFKAKYEELGRDGVELAKTMIRSLMGDAVAVLGESMHSLKASDKIDAAYKVLTLGGMATSQNISVTAAPDQVAGALGWKPKDSDEQ